MLFVGDNDGVFAHVCDLKIVVTLATKDDEFSN
jgi:hypothetical protein